MTRHSPFGHRSLTTTVMQCPREQRREALLQLAAVHDPAQQPALQHALSTVKAGPDTVWQGLWIATQAGHIEAAAWVQPLANQMAQLWLPRQHNSSVDALLKALQGWVNEQPIALCHVALSDDAASWETRLVTHGMRALATLEHLVWQCQTVQSPANLLILSPFAELTPAQQRALVEKVSEGSLDCPELREVLTIDALLAGFYDQAPNAPDNWYQLKHQGETIGVLLLASNPVTQRWSLQLMGLLPDWRGGGMGKEIIQQAQALASKAEARDITLTVDTQNVPAKRVYAQAGFTRYAQQRLLAWC
ncbi:GNAT family N-acetyltransferase [Halomonas qinghailakensis]|uniref:GNAT family N-acetyltransferase n=2 Tax=Halomonas TaxID=2745 RepID=A0AA46TT31_9GAMM|nr:MULTISPECIES: GNAT family N-acetyltransferase [Halomonas]UYO76053.1 GNAT family N-acetyltransferase [Halomonas sp. ZZQ-149]UYV19072.1 GNAT family N-acetyltransferase [Halomonas qaidamensis]